MTKFIMMVGLPASGKSTFAEQLSIKENAIILSSDKLREEMYGNVNDTIHSKEIFEEMNSKLIEYLTAKVSVIYDATNISYKRRMELLQLIKYVVDFKEVYIMATPYEKCLEQNGKRDRVVPEEAIKRMYMNFYIPQYFEGWSKINIIYNDDQMEFSINELFDGKDGLNKLEHDNPHHTLNVGEHCMKCCDNLSDYKGSPLFIAGMFHDIGKGFTKEFSKEKSDQEIWMDIIEFESKYQVSNFGNIRNKKKGNILKGRLHTGGYLQINIRESSKSKPKNYYIHRLVAKYFCDFPNELIHKELGNIDVNHIDGNKQNNYYKNLEWCNRSHNQKHAFQTIEGRNILGVDKYNAKLTYEQVDEIKLLKLNSDLSNKKIGDIYGVDRSVISRIINNKKYLKNENNITKIEPILPRKYATYYQHHNVSAYMSVFYTKSQSDDTILEIAKYITWHMQPFFVEKEKTKQKYIKLLGQEFWDRLMILHEADVKAH